MQAPKILHYAVSMTRTGRVFIVMSRDGIVDIMLAEPNAPIRETLATARLRFPNTIFLPDDGARGSWAAAAVARLDGASADFMVPIDLGESASHAPPRESAVAACQYAS